ncbi:MAG: serine/threonine-protein kinase, partial [Elusimicrobiota bacterium]
SGMIADYKLAARMSPQFESDLMAVAKKYGIAISIPDVREASAKPKKARSRRFMVILASSITGGLLIAFGLLHILMPARRKTAPGGAETQAALAGGAGLGKSFKILRVIGNGGMGVVYEALDKALDRKVAIKKRRDEIRLNIRERERFLQEARIVAALHHPNIVDIHSILEEEGELYMVFECVDGSTLDEIIHKKTRLSLRESIFSAQGICNALGYAHGKGVIHRDLKPANVMITKDGMVKVMDFGIARQAADAVLAATQTQTVAGTPQYMAPEQEQGKVARESDVFALTACVYEMITGERPFKGPNTTASKLDKNYPKPSRVTKNLPAGMDSFIDAGLEPDPKNRIHSAAEFMTRFTEAASGMQATG